MLGFNDIRKGKVIVFDGEPCLVMSAQFLRKQASRPVMRTKLKSLRSGSTKEHSFHQSDKVEEADVQRLQAQFLYTDAEQLQFMDQSTYEQFSMARSGVEAADLLLEGQEVTTVMFDGAPVSIELPIKVERQVIEAPPGVKGDTATGATKDIVVEGGLVVRAPLFIKAGDTVLIDTRDKSYAERVG